MIISQGTNVDIVYSLTLDNGDVVDSCTQEDPLRYTQGTMQLLPALEKALEGKQTGDSVTISLPPEEGYGNVLEDAYVDVPLDHLPQEARTVGAQITAVGPQQQEIPGIVKELREQTALIDFNHPLAGQTLHFDVTVHAVQAAEQE